MAKLNTNTVLTPGSLSGSGSGLTQIIVPKLGGMLIAVPAPGSIGPVGPASTVPGPQGPPGPMGPKGIDGAGALTADALGSLVHSAGPVTTVVDADEFTVADSADSFKAKRFSWSSLKAAILAWFGPATATLTNKNLSAASNVFPTSLVTLTGAQALSNKTLVSPTISNPTIDDTAGNHLLVFSPRVNAVNYIALTNEAAGTEPDITVGGPAAEVNIGIKARGPGGSVVLKTTGGTVAQFTGQSAMVNNFKFYGAPAGISPRLTLEGADTDVGLSIRTKGNGLVDINTFPAGAKVAAPASATDPGQPGQFAADANFIYAYTGDGTTHSWVRSAAATW